MDPEEARRRHENARLIATAAGQRLAAQRAAIDERVRRETAARALARRRPLQLGEDRQVRAARSTDRPSDATTGRRAREHLRH
jgi:hypothetical protein